MGLNQTNITDLIENQSLIYNSSIVSVNQTLQFNYSEANSTEIYNSSQISAIIDNAESAASAGSADIQYASSPIVVPYGLIKQGGIPTATGSHIVGEENKNHVLAVYDVEIKKATPTLAYSVAGVKDSIGTQQKPVVVYVPILDGRSTYNLSVGLSAALLNSLNLSYSLKLSDGRVLESADIHASNVNKTLNLIGLPTNENITLVFDAQGNANYTSVDPVVIVVPTEIVAFVPITFTNTQSSAIASGTELPVNFNALRYQAYESNSLNNTEFFFPNGIIIQSWMEGNVLNELTPADQLYQASNVLFWLNYSWPSGFLPATTGSNTIYMGFAAKNVQLFSMPVVGEAPQLSCANPAVTSPCGSGGGTAGVYGEYDNANVMFPFYANFTGGALPSYMTDKAGSGGSVAVANALKITTGTAKADNVTVSANKTGYSEPLILDAYLISTSANGTYLCEGTSTTSKVDLVLEDDYCNRYGLTHENLTDYKTSGAIGTVSNVVFTQAGNTIDSVAWTATGAEKTYLDYATEITSSNTAQTIESKYYFDIGVVHHSAAAVQTVQWMRAREYPPSGVYPTVSFGGTVSNTMTVLVSPSAYQAFDVGQSLTITYAATVSGGIVPYTYNWIITNSIGGAIFNSLASTNSDTNAISDTLENVANTYTVNLIVTDNGLPNPQRITESLNILVNNALSVSAGPVTNTISQGENAIVTGTVTGGTSPFTYQWLATAANGNTYNSFDANALCAGTTETALSCNFATNSLTTAGTYGFELQVTDSATTQVTQTSNPVNVIVIVPQCAISLSPNALDFGTLTPTSSTATQNVIIDTNSQAATANILIYGTDWIGTNSDSFGVSNTAWAGTADVPFADANALTSSAVLTPLTVEGSGSADVYIGIEVPPGALGDIYTQNIIIENSC